MHASMAFLVTIKAKFFYQLIFHPRLVLHLFTDLLLLFVLLDAFEHVF